MMTEEKTEYSPLPPDDLTRSLTLAQPDNLPHIGLVGDTYTITVTGEDTNGRFCVIDMHIPPGGGPPPHRQDFDRAGWRHTEHSGQRSPSISQRFHRAGTHALYLLACGTGEVLHRGGCT